MVARSESEPVAKVIEAYLHNPFGVDPTVRTEADSTLRELDVPRVLASLVRQRDLDRAKDLVLAVGHWQARRSANPAEVLTEAVFPKSVGKALPRPRGDYLRIVTAAGRCYQTLAGLCGESDAMRRARRETWAACFGDSLRHALELERVIRDHDVLILGETGTGKETFAHAIQMATAGGPDGEPSPRSAINAAAIPDTLVESELFGHVKGAFTGATDTRTGRLRTADGGAFFLDEVGDLPFTTQVKFLRVIETNEVYPVGSDTPHTVDLRYVAATHKDLGQMVDDKEFRADLYERLAGNVLTVPPLRDRPEDILDIGEYFIEMYLRRVRVAKPDTIDSWLRSREARNYAWPGNVRELQNALRNLLLGLEPGLRGASSVFASPSSDVEGLPPAIRDSTASLQDVSDWYMERVLAATDSNYTQAARTLGVDRSTVRRRTKALRRG